MAKTPIKYSVVDAFTDSAFKGNPAAVCLLEEERDEEWLQAVAREFNISETCYLTPITESHKSPSDPRLPRFRLRWFTPVAEVRLCGHATLAAAYTLFNSGLVNSNTIEFVTLSGVLTAKRVPEDKALDTTTFQNGEANALFSIELDFPTVPIIEFNSLEISDSVSKALDNTPIIDILKTTTENDLLVVYPSGEMVADFKPNFDEILRCPGRGIIITGVAPVDSGFDFYSRFFCPKFGINEDPVCGSAHCALASYWSKKLGKSYFVAYAASPRGGIVNLHLNDLDKRVLLRGKAITVMEGSLLV